MIRSAEADSLVCIFQLADLRCAIRLASVVEIVPMAALATPPGMPAVLQGLLTLRGRTVPVLKLASLFGLPDVRLDLHTPLLVVRDASGPIALLVNQVRGIVEASGLVSVPDTESLNGCVDGQFIADGQAVHLLSLDRLMLEQERVRLMEFQAAVARRQTEFEGAPS